MLRQQTCSSEEDTAPLASGCSSRSAIRVAVGSRTCEARHVEVSTRRAITSSVRYACNQAQQVRQQTLKKLHKSFTNSLFVSKSWSWHNAALYALYQTKQS